MFYRINLFNLLAQNSNDNSCIFLYYMPEVPNVGSTIPISLINSPTIHKWSRFLTVIDFIKDIFWYSQDLRQSKLKTPYVGANGICPHAHVLPVPKSWLNKNAIISFMISLEVTKSQGVTSKLNDRYSNNLRQSIE